MTSSLCAYLQLALWYFDPAGVTYTIISSGVVVGVGDGDSGTGDGLGEAIAGTEDGLIDGKTEGEGEITELVGEYGGCSTVDFCIDS